MPNFVGILDTETNKNRVEYDGTIESDRAIVKSLENKLRGATFRDVIYDIIGNAGSEDKPLADEIQRYVEEHNGASTICEIRTCDTEGNYVQGKNNATVLNLDEKVEPYISNRNVDGEDIDCIEMVLGQITSVGGE